MPKLNRTRTETTHLRPLTLILLMLAGLTACRNSGAAETTETWTGTWNAPNLWRAVDLTLRTGSPEQSTFAIGTAREKVEAVTLGFAADGTSMKAEIDYAGTVVHLTGKVAGGTAGGRLKVVRGETTLTEGTWTLERYAPSDLSAGEIMDRVRRALHFPGTLAAGYTVEESPVPTEGSQAPPGSGWAARVGARGEIAVSENGDPSLVYDGSKLSLNRQPFGWMPSDVRMQEKTMLAEMVRSSAWLAEGSTLKQTARVTGSGTDRRYVIGITTAAGVVPARVIIDPATWLPESAAASWDAGDRSFRFADFVEQAGCLFPGKITAGYRGKEQEWRTTRVVPGAGTFEAPASGGSTYDTSASPVLEGTYGAGEDGHLFVRPVVAGRDFGWFHVDTGAPFMILDTKVADELGLEVVRAMGPRSLRRIPEIRVGQLILSDQPVLVQDLSESSAPDSARRAGVIGGPVFERSVVIFDYSGKRLSVFAPEAFRENVSAWQSLSLEGPPVIEALFDDVVDRFFIDTGKSGAASFLSHAAARSGLHRGRTFEEAPNLTVEGTTIELVTHLTSFALGGRRFEKPEVRVKIPGTTNDDIGSTAGFVGRGFFRDRRVVFDYAKGRIAFLR